VTVHGQVVCCPGINDGAILDDTLRGVLERFPQIASLGVVPLGVSAHNHEPEMRSHTRAEAEAVIDTIERWQTRYRATLGRSLVHAADEYYLLADRPCPALEHYDGCPQHENGIGMLRTFAAEIDAALAGAAPAQADARWGGFFAWVDGAPAEGYRAPRRSNAVVSASASDADHTENATTWLVTGELGAPALAPHLDALSAHAGVAVQALVVRNDFFGGNIGVTGLLTGADVDDALASVPKDDRVLLPDVVLSRDRFLDGRGLADLCRPVEVVATDGGALVAALTRTSP
jgi:NifB/MoaA-like Fe-S oxidoreductase